VSRTSIVAWPAPVRLTSTVIVRHWSVLIALCMRSLGLTHERSVPRGMNLDRSFEREVLLLLVGQYPELIDDISAKAARSAFRR